MLRAIIANKLNMERLFDKHGRSVPVTYVKSGPMTIAQIKEKEKDGYDGVQVGFGVKKKVSKGVSGHLKKWGVKENLKYIRELPFKGELKHGEVVNIADVFRVGDLVDVTGINKGKGFAGVVKRHGFRGGPRTHGQSDRERAPGSIGSTTTPGRVFKGLKMAGHMGAEQVTIQGLEILSIDKENNILGIKGALPGNKGNVLILKKSIKKKKAYHEPEIPQAPVVGGGDQEEVKEETTQIEGVSEDQSATVPSAEEQTEVKSEGEENNG